MNINDIDQLREHLLTHYKKTMESNLEDKIGINRVAFVNFLKGKRPPRFTTCLKVQRYLESLPLKES